MSEGDKEAPPRVTTPAMIAAGASIFAILSTILGYGVSLHTKVDLLVSKSARIDAIDDRTRALERVVENLSTTRLFLLEDYRNELSRLNAEMDMIRENEREQDRLLAPLHDIGPEQRLGPARRR